MQSTLWNGLFVCLVICNAVLVGYILPNTPQYCTTRSTWYALGAILIYAYVLPTQYAMSVGLIWMLGSIPCFTVRPAIPSDHPGEEHFVSERRRRRRRRRKKSKQPKVDERFRQRSSPATDFTKKFVNSLGMTSLDQKTEAFKNQVRQINHEISGLQQHINQNLANANTSVT